MKPLGADHQVRVRPSFQLLKLIYNCEDLIMIVVDHEITVVPPLTALYNGHLSTTAIPLLLLKPLCD